MFALWVIDAQGLSLNFLGQRARGIEITVIKDRQPGEFILIRIGSTRNLHFQKELLSFMPVRFGFSIPTVVILHPTHHTDRIS